MSADPVAPLTPGTPGRPLVYRVELAREPDGTWALYYDGTLVTRSVHTVMSPDSAREWASYMLGRRDLAWVNALDVPDAESGCWLADPEPETVPQGHSFGYAFTALLIAVAAFTSCALASSFGWHPAATRPATGALAVGLIACAVWLNRSAS